MWTLLRAEKFSNLEIRSYRHFSNVISSYVAMAQENKWHDFVQLLLSDSGLRDFLEQPDTSFVFSFNYNKVVKVYNQWRTRKNKDDIDDNGDGSGRKSSKTKKQKSKGNKSSPTGEPNDIDNFPTKYMNSKYYYWDNVMQIITDNQEMSKFFNKQMENNSDFIQDKIVDSDCKCFGHFFVKMMKTKGVNDLFPGTGGKGNIMAPKLLLTLLHILYIQVL